MVSVVFAVDFPFKLFDLFFSFISKIPCHSPAIVFSIICIAVDSSNFPNFLRTNFRAVALLFFHFFSLSRVSHKSVNEFEMKGRIKFFFFSLLILLLLFSLLFVSVWFIVWCSLALLSALLFALLFALLSS